MTKPDYVVSDTHLGAVPKETERAFVRFLEHVGANAASLLINGDLFDFWFEWGPVIPARHYRVLAALADVVDAGVPITMIGGNHDAWGGRFLEEDVGMRVLDGILRTKLGGRNSIVAHGDGLGKGDYKYRMLKLTLRSKPAIWGFRALHPELGMWLTDRVSNTEENAKRSGSRGRSDFLQHWAEEQLAENPDVQFVTCGHSHEPTKVELEPGRFYVNSGDWVKHRSYVTIQEGSAPELMSWS